MWPSKRLRLSSGMTTRCKQCFDLDSKAAFLTIKPPQDQPSASTGPSFVEVVTLVASNDDTTSRTSVLAHKIILASRSPVFQAMFENDMQESRCSTINISEVSGCTLRAFVNFLYAGETSLDDKMARDLMILAERYQVQYLKTYCEKFLLGNLMWEKVIETYVFARQYNASELLDGAVKLISDKIQDFTKHPEYELLVENDPQLLIQIYEAYSSKKLKMSRWDRSNFYSLYHDL